MSVYPRWRVRFDPPHEACIIPGLTRASLLGNIRRDIKILNDPTNGQSCWQDPLTGVMMLRPNVFTERGPEAFTALSQWRHQVGFWRESRRAMDSLATGGTVVTPSVISLTRPSDSSGPMALEPLTGVTLAAISLASELQNDTLIPAFESNFTFPEDAGFVIHARLHTDSARRNRNWFAVAWGRYYLHVSPLGKVRLYRWAGATTVEPTLVYEKELFNPAGVAGIDHAFFVIPIPGRGLAVYHSLSSTTLTPTLSSGDATAPVGYLFDVPTEEVTSGEDSYFRINTASKVTIYLSKSQMVGHDVAFARITYPTRGAFAGELFDLERARTAAPDALGVQALPTHPAIAGYITKSLLGPDPTAAWTTANQQARFGVVINRIDEYHTPFVYSTYVDWAPIRDLRDPGIVEMDAVEMLAHTQEDTGRWEGKAVVRAWSDAAKRLIERGDAYHIVERQDTEGGAWVVEYGGIARVESGASAHIINGRFEYQATWTLGDMTTRLREASCLWKTAFDDLTLQEASNTVLQALGEPVLTSAPARFSSVRIPATRNNESNWQNGPKVGDDGYEILRRFLALGRQSVKEPRLVHTWGSVATGTGGRWDIEDKPRLTDAGNTWSLTDKITEEDIPARRVGIRRDQNDPTQLFSFSPVPPGATILQVFGVQGTQPSSAQFLPGKPIRNHAGLNTPASLEYLGRTVTSYPLISGVGDPGILDRIARAVYDLSCRWKNNLTVELTRYVSGLRPAVQISGIRYETYSEAESAYVMRELQWRDNPAEESTRHHLWVRRRRIIQTHCEIAANVYLDLSTQWESGIDD